MKDQFVTYEIALKIKELGFDEVCFGNYVNDKLVLNHEIYSYHHDKEKYSFINAPLWQQAFDYLMKKHDTYITLNLKDKEHINAHIHGHLQMGPMKNGYKDARERILLKALEIIKES